VLGKRDIDNEYNLFWAITNLVLPECVHAFLRKYSWWFIGAIVLVLAIIAFATK